MVSDDASFAGAVCVAKRPSRAERGFAVRSMHLTLFVHAANTFRRGFLLLARDQFASLRVPPVGTVGHSMFAMTIGARSGIVRIRENRPV